MRKHIALQNQAKYDDKKNSNKGLHILEDSASGVQVGDIGQEIKHESIISSNPVCYNECHIVESYVLKKVTYVDKVASG